MPDLEITQTRSHAGRESGQRRTLRALGLRKIRQTVRHPDRPESRGMVGKVAHRVDVRYVGGEAELDLEPGQAPKGLGNPPAGSSIGDEESAEIAEATEEALAVSGSVDSAADVIENPPSLGATDEPVKPKTRGGPGGEDSDEASEAGDERAEDDEAAADQSEESEESET